MINKIKSLTPEVIHIVRDKGTEAPYHNKYENFSSQGTYLCRQCGLALFRSDHKFLSSCGWPSFDDELPDTILRVSDVDGRRTEILCQRCRAHLGHVFSGEGMTQKNLRHCVNSLAIEFVIDDTVVDTEEAIYAGGCFWGMQTLFDQAVGVLKTEVGYSGGTLQAPTYHDVVAGHTGHLEAVRVLFDLKKTNYEELTKLFFEIHDPTQHNGQGPDIGENYLSAILYFNQQQKDIANKLIQILKEKGYAVATRLIEATTFWSAEEYHQKYYKKTGGQPYCHFRTPRFNQ